MVFVLLVLFGFFLRSPFLCFFEVPCFFGKEKVGFGGWKSRFCLSKGVFFGAKIDLFEGEVGVLRGKGLFWGESWTNPSVSSCCGVFEVLV